MASTLAEYLASQEELVKEAALALPHQFSRCSYSLGPLRQAVYLCLTCPEARGLCSACSIACHTDHDQIELFPKRKFRCDCPTNAIAHPCTLHKTLEEENTANTYGQNFKGRFCRCERPYNPKTERETMIQCLACEDWFHESCCNLRERPSSTETTPEPYPKDTASTQDINDTVSEASSSGLPPPLISGSEYESFVCGTCVSKNDILKRWAGTPGITIIIRDGPTEPWKCLNNDNHLPSSEPVDTEDGPDNSTAGAKRPLSPSNVHVPEAKRPRGTYTAFTSPSGLCLAPKLNPIAQTVFVNRVTPAKYPTGTGDIFLSENFRERWCHCTLCLPPLTRHPYLLEEEELYEPPEDPDSGLSLEELGMRALERLPRDRAIDGIHAFHEMRDNLVKYLRPFAQEGKVVKETDVRDFFASLEATKNSHG